MLPTMCMRRHQAFALAPMNWSNSTTKKSKLVCAAMDVFFRASITYCGAVGSETRGHLPPYSLRTGRYRHIARAECPYGVATKRRRSAREAIYRNRPIVHVIETLCCDRRRTSRRGGTQCKSSSIISQPGGKRCNSANKRPRLGQGRCGLPLRGTMIFNSMCSKSLTS